MIVAIATVSSLTTSRFLSNTRATSAITTRSSSFNLNADLFKDIEDEEELTSFKRIVTSYLSAKFKECRGEDCKYTREKSEVADLLKIVLPPVSKEELEKEVEVVISKMGPGDVVLENDYVQAVLENSYWADAGHFVVKELIFLDCLNNFYQDKETNNLLGDEDYDELKEQLSWDGKTSNVIFRTPYIHTYTLYTHTHTYHTPLSLPGSVAASLNALEARFISAVAASRRGNSIVSGTYTLHTLYPLYTLYTL